MSNKKYLYVKEDTHTLPDKNLRRWMLNEVSLFFDDGVYLSSEKRSDLEAGMYGIIDDDSPSSSSTQNLLRIQLVLLEAKKYLERRIAMTLYGKPLTDKMKQLDEYLRTTPSSVDKVLSDIAMLRQYPGAFSKEDLIKIWVDNQYEFYRNRQDVSGIELNREQYMAFALRYMSALSLDKLEFLLKMQQVAEQMQKWTLRTEMIQSVNESKELGPFCEFKNINDKSMV